MKRILFIYFIIGILIITGLVYLNASGISDINKELYENAMVLEGTMESQVWKGFKISDYPLAIRKGDTEYVFYNGDIKKRAPILDVYACTALKVEEEMNIFILSFEDMDSIMNPTGISSDFSNKNHYIATIFHEGFHAFQWDNFENIFDESFFNYEEGTNLLEEANIELYDQINHVLNKIDNDEYIKSLYENELRILYNGIKETDKSKKEEIVKSYVNEREKRNKALSKKLSVQEFEVLILAENYYELVEGTAHYVELKAIEVLKDKVRYNELIASLNRYHINNVKYYKSGMAISLLLDELDDNWKDSVFRDNKSLFEKLKIL